MSFFGVRRFKTSLGGCWEARLSRSRRPSFPRELSRGLERAFKIGHSEDIVFGRHKP